MSRLGTKQTGALLALVTMVAACGPSRPAWVDGRDMERFPEKQFLVGVGSAAVNDDNMTRARALASASARDELAKTVRTTVKTSTQAGLQETMTRDGNERGYQSKETLKFNVDETVEQTLSGVEVIEFYQEGNTLYALATLNLKEQIDGARRWLMDQQSTLEPMWMRARKAAKEGDIVTAIRGAEQTLRSIPKPTANYQFVRLVVPGALDDIGVNPNAVRAEVKRWLSQVQVSVTSSPAPLVNGEAGEIALTTSAPNTPLLVSFAPQVEEPQAVVTSMSGSARVKIPRAAGGNAGSLRVSVGLDTSKVLENGMLADAAAAEIGAASLTVSGDSPLAVIFVREPQGKCRPDTLTVVWQAAAGCAEKQGYRSTDLESLSADAASQMQSITKINKFTYESVLGPALKNAKRFIDISVTCKADAPMKLDGGGEMHLSKIAYTERSIPVGATDAFEVEQRAVEVSGAGPDLSGAVRAAQRKLADTVCQTNHN